MTRGFIFWLIMILWLLLWIVGFTDYGARPYYHSGFNAVTFTLFALLGWQVFGSAVKG